MPAKKKKLSALKALRQSRKRHLRNKAGKTRIKRLVSSARAALRGSAEGARGGSAEQAVRAAARMLDKAASKGLIHKNTAARKKSRLMRQLALKAAGAAPSQAEPSTPAQ